VWRNRNPETSKVDDYDFDSRERSAPTISTILLCFVLSLNVYKLIGRSLKSSRCVQINLREIITAPAALCRRSWEPTFHSSSLWRHAYFSQSASRTVCWRHLTLLSRPDKNPSQANKLGPQFPINSLRENRFTRKGIVNRPVGRPPK